MPMASRPTATRPRSSSASPISPAGRCAVTFTPHLMPMSRGILATIYVRLQAGVAATDLHARARARLRGRAVRARAAVQEPAGDAACARHQSVPDRGPSRAACRAEAILVSVIDNLVKGASGQAVQNMNLMLGLDERLGLGQRPLFP